MQEFHNGQPKQRSLVTNAGLSIIRQCCSILFPIIMFPYISRTIGAANMGRYSFVDSIVNYFALLAGLGISTYAVREGARVRNDAGEIRKLTSELFSINLCSMAISYTLLIALVWFVPRLREEKLLFFILSFNIAGTVLGRDWINTIYEDFLYITLRYILFHLLSLMLVFLFIRRPEDYLKYALIMLLANTGGAVANIFYTRRYVPYKITRQLHLEKHGRTVLMLFCITLSTTVYVSSDTTVLGFLRSDAEVGVYSVASKMYTVVKMLLNAAISVTVPRLANYLGEGLYDQYRELLNKLRKVLCIIVFPCVTGLFFLNYETIALFGGKEYVPGATALRILCFALAFAVFGCFYAHGVLVANRKDSYFFKATIISAIANILLNIIFIPYFGINCAAVTTVFAEMIVMGACGFYARKLVPLKDDGNMVSVLAGCIMIAAVCLLTKRFTVQLMPRVAISVTVSVAAYFSTLLLMKNAIMIEFLKNSVMGRLKRK